MLRYLSDQGCHGFLVDGTTLLTMVQDERVRFEDTSRGLLSVFAQGGGAEQVTIRNLHYTLENGSMSNRYPLGVSNEFIGEEACIEVRDGALLLVWEHEKSDFKMVRFEAL